MPFHALRTASWRYPRMLLAAKGAVAAGLAWALVQPLGGFVDDYPYYAPLGAVVAMSTSVVSSVRNTARALLAITTGATLALAIHGLAPPAPLGIAVGIGAGLLLAGVPLFGPMGSWVPFATLFVLIIGGDEPWQYALAYGALVTLGGLVGLLANLAVPQLPLTPAGLAVDRLRERLADQLDLLADGLVHEQPLTQEDWAEMRLALEPDARRVEELVHAASEARRANWQAARWAETADRREAHARALQRLTGCVDEVIALVVDVRTSVHADGEVPGQLRVEAAAAFRSVAAMLRTAADEDGSAREEDEDGQATPTAAASAAGAVDRLARAAGDAIASTGERYLAAAAIAVSLHQAVDAWT